MARLVSACIASLVEEQQRARGAVEVILVESSGDGTAESLAARFPTIRVLASQKRLNAAEARNLGAREASATLLAFVDADCTVPAGFADAVLRAHDGNDAPVAGAVVPAKGGGVVAFLLACIEFSAQLPRRNSAARTVSFAPTCNLSLRRDALRDAGGFPEEHARSHDLAFCARWLAAGRPRFRALSSPWIIHHGPTRVADTALHLYTLGRASAAVRNSEARAGRALPGALAASVPLLAPLLVPIRFVAITARLAAAEDGARRGAAFVALTPLALAGLSVWALGFAAGARARGAQ